jgi:AAA family ATP:ADP antiporter
MLQRILRPLVDTRREETKTVLLMFSYSFLAMTAYNMVQPITRSKFITAHGAENLPYVVLASIVLITLLMQGYSKLGRLMPGRWIIPVTQAAMVVLLVVFWSLYADPPKAEAGAPAPEVGAMQGWVATALYWFGQIYAILLISQFWTLANLIFDPRQAKRVFGFIGAGSSLGGFAGGALPAFFAQTLGSRQVLLVSAMVLTACAVVVIVIVSRERGADLRGLEGAGEEKGVGGQEALRMLRESRHLQIISVVIGLTSIGAGLVDQQLNMATEAFKGREQTDAMTAVLGQVQVWVSGIGFVIQMFLTTRIQRFLGVGFALMLLPLGFGAMAVIILLNAALWAPMLARVMDKSLRYTVDKTSREILFLPLPDAIKNKAKPFVDVTADRFARAVQGFLVLILIAPWGLSLTWQQISYVSLLVMAGWIGMVMVAKRAYASAFRASLERLDVKPAEVRLAVADLSTVETLVEELAHPDEQRVLHAIDLLESLDKRNLVTPLLLNHPSPRVRARALAGMGSVKPEIAERWAPAVERMLGDDHGDVRAAAVAALAAIRKVDAGELVRPFLASDDPRIVVTAAVVLAGTGREADIAEAERAFARLSEDSGRAAGEARRHMAVAVRHIGDPRFRHLLIPLLNDADPAVAEEALRSVKALGELDFLFVPTLIALLRHRRLKATARDILVSYGEPVVGALAHFMRDPEEDIWVRRHVPATLARIPCQATMDALVSALGEPDGFLRFKAVAAIERLRRDHPELTFPREPIEKLALGESLRSLTYLSLRYNLVERAKVPVDALLVKALDQKMSREIDRVYRLAGLIYPWKDIADARWAIERGGARARASALEYLDNLLTGALRKRLMLVFEDAPVEEKVRRANVELRTRPRDEEETLLQLINDDDEVVSALAIDLVRQRRVWALEDDIEHVLAHRDARDWFVFEAASWTLAERRMPTDRVRQLWLEPLPATIIAQRLSRLPMFASVHVDELFRIASAGRQARHEAGQMLCQQGTPAEGFTALLDGRSVGSGDRGEHPLDAPAMLGFEEFLEERPLAETVRTVEVAVTLSLREDELRTLLADNTNLVEGLFRTLVERDPDRARLLTHGDYADEVASGAPAMLTALEKALVLRRVPVFSQVSAAEGLQLGGIAQGLTFAPGRTIGGAADACAILVLLVGEVALESAGPSGEDTIVARRGDVVGLFETLAGLPLGRRLVSRTGGAALRITREDLFDLMGQRQSLLQQLLGALFRNGRS